MPWLLTQFLEQCLSSWKRGTWRLENVQAVHSGVGKEARFKERGVGVACSRWHSAGRGNRRGNLSPRVGGMGRTKSRLDRREKVLLISIECCDQNYRAASYTCVHLVYRPLSNALIIAQGLEARHHGAHSA